MQITKESEFTLIAEKQVVDRRRISLDELLDARQKLQAQLAEIESMIQQAESLGIKSQLAEAVKTVFGTNVTNLFKE